MVLISRRILAMWLLYPARFFNYYFVLSRFELLQICLKFLVRVSLSRSQQLIF